MSIPFNLKGNGNIVFSVISQTQLFRTRHRLVPWTLGCGVNIQFNTSMPSGAFNICCPRDCVSRHNGGTSGAPLKPLRVDSALSDVFCTQWLVYINLRARLQTFYDWFKKKYTIGNTQRSPFLIHVKSTQIWLYIPFFGLFWPKPNFLRLQIDRKMVIKIWYHAVDFTRIISWFISPTNSTRRRFPSYILFTLLLFYFHLLPSPVHRTEFSSFSSLAYLPFLSCYRHNNNKTTFSVLIL